MLRDIPDASHTFFHTQHGEDARLLTTRNSVPWLSHRKLQVLLIFESFDHLEGVFC